MDEGERMDEGEGIDEGVSGGGTGGESVILGEGGGERMYGRERERMGRPPKPPKWKKKRRPFDHVF